MNRYLMYVYAYPTWCVNKSEITFLLAFFPSLARYLYFLFEHCTTQLHISAAIHDSQNDMRFLRSLKFPQLNTDPLLKLTISSTFIWKIGNSFLDSFEKKTLFNHMTFMIFEFFSTRFRFKKL